MNPYPAQPVIDKGGLPDVFQPPGLPAVSEPADWPPAAIRWRDRVVEGLYGGFPPPPDAVRIEALSHAVARRLRGEPKIFTYRVHCLGGRAPLHFCVRLLVPSTPGPHPTIINGDQCWWYVSDQVAESVLAAGCALALFNRTELAEDLGSRNDRLRDDHLPLGHGADPSRNDRRGALYDFAGDRTFGALSAWAWAYHRCVDLVLQLPFLDPGRIGASGHSRGAKAVLLAGAMDPRIRLVNDNGSCAGGSALFRFVGSGGETSRILHEIPSWFGPDAANWMGREEEMPFDQHCLLAALAPRPTLITYALDDRWSNPEGMVLSVAAARPAWNLLNQADNLAFHLRPGEHAHAPEDWAALMDFVRWKWFGETPTRPYNRHPYTHLDRAACRKDRRPATLHPGR